jgi:hypothetical protein
VGEIKMIKKLIISSLVAISIIGILPVGASATWKEDKNKNRIWVENGVRAKGWKQIEGQWYNFDDNGIMKTGWMMDNGSWYYLWSNGMMASNMWLGNGNYWYYFDANGKRVSDSATVQHRKYDLANIGVIFSEELDNSISKTGTIIPSNN